MFARKYSCCTMFFLLITIEIVMFARVALSMFTFSSNSNKNTTDSNYEDIFRLCLFTFICGNTMLYYLILILHKKIFFMNLCTFEVFISLCRLWKDF